MFEVEVPSGSTGLVPLRKEVELLAGPWVKLTVPPETLTGEVIETVLTSATVEASVHVDTPEALLALQVP
jgi:hypothetical protein